MLWCLNLHLAFVDLFYLGWCVCLCRMSKQALFSESSTGLNLWVSEWVSDPVVRVYGEDSRVQAERPSHTDPEGQKRARGWDSLAIFIPPAVPSPQWAETLSFAPNLWVHGDRSPRSHHESKKEKEKVKRVSFFSSLPCSDAWIRQSGAVYLQ